MAAPRADDKPATGSLKISWQWVAVLIGIPTLALAIVLNRPISVKKGEIEFKIESFRPLQEKARAGEQHISGSPLPTRLSEGEIVTLLNKGNRDLPIAKVLWVDDHPTNNQVARLALAALGIYCDSYTSTADALAALRWNAENSNRPYDVIVSDWRRDAEFEANGRPTTGIDTYNAVRALPGYKSAPFVFFTADGIQAVQPIVSQDSQAASTNYFDVLLERVLHGIPPPKDTSK